MNLSHSEDKVLTKSEGREFSDFKITRLIEVCFSLPLSNKLATINKFILAIFSKSVLLIAELPTLIIHKFFENLYSEEKSLKLNG